MLVFLGFVFVFELVDFNHVVFHVHPDVSNLDADARRLVTFLANAKVETSSMFNSKPSRVMAEFSLNWLRKKFDRFSFSPSKSPMSTFTTIGKPLTQPINGIILSIKTYSKQVRTNFLEQVNQELLSNYGEFVHTGVAIQLVGWFFIKRRVVQHYHCFVGLDDVRIKN